MSQADEFRDAQTGRVKQFEHCTVAQAERRFGIGRVQQGLYGTGRALQDIGVISGHDMTPEAALTKLYCLLAADRPLDVVRRKMELDLAGEISPA